ncbi:T7SS effector LXG polymorphic toxin [Carnobacterium divergens]|uniref:T7SS effector LXG polymorphic toxin n=2 Tax=Carnobacterium TaxID=2747 RepID=UPI00288EB644|nr:T7SS effector LXG polymorphic toxin [Carnobacterium divergens]MDT1939894.1 LXG domain-containing protein [Carnobacterium divergens]MDT1942332.1 LXG domain-containing protein [Carnobacterium divergens]MDT1948138.1 LXG domain-containing protein [Carnobacterium divergens]MDT1950618.1 LXG domain-containing protein [Carnobacterium divergens]MDT1955898.1 LXG domain-containing protein [Carnobacterium divergens]
MGLVYSSGDSSNLLSSLSSNLGTAKSTVNELKSGSQRLTAAVDGRTLSGAAYNAGKGLFSELILPTINRVTASMDGIQNDLVKYEGANKEISKEGYLNEDNLKLQIQLMKASKSALTASADTFKNLATVSPIPGLKDMLNHAQERLNRMANSMQDDIDKLQKKIKKLHDFSNQTNGLFSNSLNEMKIAMQGVLVLSGTTVNSDGSYSLPSGTDKSWFTKIQSEKAKSELDKQYDEVKEWNKLYKEFIKTGDKSFKSVWYGARVSRLSDGTLIVTTVTGMSKRLDEFTGFSKFVKQHKNFNRISSGGILTKDGLKILKEAKLNDVGTLTKGVSGRFGDMAKATWGAIKPDVSSAIKKPVTFGLNTILKDAKNLKTAKGFGKVIPGLNIASGAIDVGTGIKDSYALAKEDGLKGGQVLASQAGGVAVDVTKVAVTTAAATVAATVGAAAVTAGLGLVGIATAPVGLTAAAAVLVGWGAVKGVEFIDKKLGITKGLKKGVNSLIKGVGGWFK